MGDLPQGLEVCNPDFNYWKSELRLPQLPNNLTNATGHVAMPR